MLEIGMYIGVGIAARHAGHAEHMHREKRAVEADERQYEMKLTDGIVHHPAEHFREPEWNGSKHAKIKSRRTIYNGSERR